MEQIAENCYFLRGKGLCSNIYLLQDSKATILIDSGDGSIDVEKEAGTKPDIAILTHGHFDHTRGIKKGWKAFLRPEDILSTFPFNVPQNVEQLKFVRKKISTFNLEIIHTPGHSPGSICIFEKRRKILFTGDLLYSDGWIGRSDLYGGDEKAMQRSLEKILLRFSKSKSEIKKTELKLPLKLSLNISLLCPGHGDFKYFR